MTDSLHPLLAKSIEAQFDSVSGPCGCEFIFDTVNRLCRYHTGMKDGIEVKAQQVAEQLRAINELPPDHRPHLLVDLLAALTQGASE